MYYPDSLTTLSFGLLAAAFLNVGLVLGDDDCQPSTWGNARLKQADATSPPRPKITKHPKTKAANEVAPGDPVCRFWTESPEEVNYYTCSAMAESYGITVELFFQLNPGIDDSDCSNIEPNTEYCVAGYIQPIINEDGTCGPKHGNGTCGMTEKPCCNSETWECGDKVEDCTDGICYEGICPGHDVYTTDGKCGYQNNNRLCAGKWGDCCNFDGECGTGSSYCGTGNCQAGKCTEDIQREALRSLHARVNVAGMFGHLY
ncbi:CFEM domain-containing protein [Sarocladium implicatum]|nr:CFEM domain-containing protein [Sarocladium implicatum]